MNDIASTAEPSAASLARCARRLYREAPPIQRVLQVLRPFICPFHRLMELVPPGARILDIGCGAGLFLGLLSESNRIEEGVGFDVNPKSVRVAQTMARALNGPARLTLERIEASVPWPAGPFDAVSMVDVMHHVHPGEQPHIAARAAAVLKPGGLFIYKDMVSRPVWRAWANRLHDLIMARQWIHYASLEQVHRWAARAGLELQSSGQCNMFWYGHEWAVYRKTEACREPVGNPEPRR
jgi:SAM-dependent methyltransferase